MFSKKKVNLIATGIIPIALIFCLITPAASAQTNVNSSQPSSLSAGTLEKITLKMAQFNDGRTRTVRVWLPDGYHANDKTKKYPVVYMQDGQNLFEKLTSFSSEWKIDETICSLMKEGYRGSIVVGIDNGGMNRDSEYNPTDKNSDGYKFADFVVNTVKPYIDAHYNTNTDRKHTAVGGSSYGGTISYFLAMKHPNIFGFAILMSTIPKYSNYVPSYIKGVNFKDSDNLPYLYFYSGGIGPEQEAQYCTNEINNALISKGYPKSKIKIKIDNSKPHNEEAWSIYFKPAYVWFAETLPKEPEIQDSSKPVSVSSSSLPVSSKLDSESKIYNPKTGNFNKVILICIICIGIILTTAVIVFFKLKSKAKKN